MSERRVDPQSDLLSDGLPGLPLKLTRRRFLGTGLAGVAGFTAVRCGGVTADQRGVGTSRLGARPHAPARTLGPGTHQLASVIGVDCTLFVPDDYRAENPAGLFVVLHGAGESRNHMHQFFPPAAGYDLLVLVPRAADRTWDMVLGGFGPDVKAIDRALAHAFDHCNIDPARVALGGFSDGGSYALSLGLDNGDLFTHIIAFSPGFMGSQERIGRPGIRIFHGTGDTILPIQSTSRRIVEQLHAWDYEVTYEEFDGPHTVRIEDVRTSFDWMTNRGSAGAPTVAVPDTIRGR
jgi:phospholipase/carboxylesterase